MYSIIDIESNGAKFREEKIIDIAIYQFDGHSITDQFASLVNPQAAISPFVQKLTGISPKMVKTAPKFHEIAKRIVEITEGTTLVGHNIDFDYRMLRQSFKTLGYEYNRNVLDTIPLAKKLIPEAESYSLGKLVASLGIPISDRHRATGDARATLDLFKILMDKDKNAEIIQEQYEETNAKTYANKVKELTQDLPNERGIYYLQDSEGHILSSDFVDNINRSVKAVLNSEAARHQALQTKTEQVSYELVGNAVLAKLILKSKGIAKKEVLSFGLYHRNGRYIAEKNAINKDEKPLLKFHSFTQAIKVVEFINVQEKFKEVEVLKTLMSLKRRNELWTMKGRQRGENVFLIIEKGKPKAFGFYEFYNQIKTKNRINQLKIEIEKSSQDLENALMLGLLQGDFKISEIP